jgi:hypothetical protein
LLEPGAPKTIWRLPASVALPAVLYHAFYFSLDGSVQQRMADQVVALVARVPIFRDNDE